MWCPILMESYKGTVKRNQLSDLASTSGKREFHIRPIFSSISSILLAKEQANDHLLVIRIMLQTIIRFFFYFVLANGPCLAVAY